MKAIYTKLLIFVAALGVSSSALAGFHMEPYLATALTGNYEFDTAVGTSGDYSRNNFGIKLGYQAPMGFQIGGDIQLGVGSYEFGNTDVDSANAEFGAYVGYQSMMGLRGYVGYMFNSAVVVDFTPDVTYTGNGFKLGVGYSFMTMGVPWFAVNLEYHMMSYDEAEQAGTTLSNQEFNNDSIMLGVSFPFNFGG